MSLLIMAYTKDKETEMAIRNANKESKEYAKKLAAVKAKLATARAANAAPKATPPQGTVKVVKPTFELANALKNDKEEQRVSRLKVGAFASEGAKVGNAMNKVDKAIGSKTPTVKINSANPTRQGTTPAIRRAGGLMGGAGGGNWRNLFR